MVGTHFAVVGAAGAILLTPHYVKVMNFIDLGVVG